MTCRFPDSWMLGYLRQSIKPAPGMLVHPEVEAFVKQMLRDLFEEYPELEDECPIPETMRRVDGVWRPL